MKLSLNKNWQLTYRDLSVTAESICEIETASDFINAGSLPCDVRMPLIENGIIKDPVLADYCYDSEWVENKSWWFTNTFSLTQQDLAADTIQLVLESLDLGADIFVNGKHIGTHFSCHYPFESNIKAVAKEDENRLTIRLTAGHETVTPEQVQAAAGFVCTETIIKRGDLRRIYLRKPQYVYGWDWSPRVVSIGIMKQAYIMINRGVAITGVHAVTTYASSAKANINFELEFESLNPIATKDAKIRLDVCFEDKTVLTLNREILAMPGVNYVKFSDVTIENPKLWWLSGAGDQHLYTVQATVTCGDDVFTNEPTQFGIRTITINTEKCDTNHRRFNLRVNGVDIYCKGANWIPSDSIYARISPDKYETLIKEAAECNFNMLRVWGGGFYEQDLFYNLCDKYGLLIWHDFMFACAVYLDDSDEFLRKVENEVAYQIRRLRHHPSIAVWCGNNEIQYIYTGDIFKKWREGNALDMGIYNRLMPKLVRAHSPEIPYWNSSPLGGEIPTDKNVGNVHYWGPCTMNEDMNKRITPEEYDKVEASFVSEYGYIGPCSEETIKKYFDGNEVQRGNKIWNLHNNTFEKETVAAGIRKHYTEPDDLNLTDYLKYARLVQGLMYAYSLEAIRFYKHSGGSLFWMYNDTWGEVGWTIVDYYLDRKPSYYYVKRAYTPVKLILRKSGFGKKVQVMGVNDTANTVALDIEFGYVSFSGQYDCDKASVLLPPFSKDIVLTFDMPAQDLRTGVIFARADGISLALLRTGDFKDYAGFESSVKIENIIADGNDYKITVKADSYCHAVHFTPKLSLCDEYFDMLPGETKTVTAYDAVGKVPQAEIQLNFL